LTALSSSEKIVVIMATVTVRKLSPQVHRALRVLAARHGRSTEAEIREILSRAVQAKHQLRIGSELRRFAKRLGGFELELRRGRKPIEPATFD
jgi:antitoxin FitA